MFMQWSISSCCSVQLDLDAITRAAGKRIPMSLRPMVQILDAVKALHQSNHDECPFRERELLYTDKSVIQSPGSFTSSTYGPDRCAALR